MMTATIITAATIRIKISEVRSFCGGPEDFFGSGRPGMRRLVLRMIDCTMAENMMCVPLTRTLTMFQVAARWFVVAAAPVRSARIGRSEKPDATAVQNNTNAASMHAEAS